MMIKEIVVALLVGLVESDDKEFGLRNLFNEFNGSSSSKTDSNSKTFEKPI